MPNAIQQNASDALAPLVKVCIRFMVLNTVFFTLRYVARWGVRSTAIGLGDGMLFIAYINNIGLCAVSLVMDHYFTKGEPPGDIPMPTSLTQMKTQVVPILKCIYALAHLNNAACALPKLSLLFLYLRIFPKRSFRIATRTTIGLVCATAISCTMTEIFACKPIHHFWDRLTPGKCINLDQFYRWVTGVNVVLDLVISALPVYPLWNLNAPWSRKIGLTIVFATASLGFGLSIVRWVLFLKHTAEMIEPRLQNVLTLWLVVEASVYLDACCFAGCGSLFYDARDYIKKKRSQSSGWQYIPRTTKTESSLATA